MHRIAYLLATALMIAQPVTAKESVDAPTVLCDGTSYAHAIAGPNQGWTPFIGRWETTRLTNHPFHEGKMEDLEISFEPAPNVTGENSPYVARGISRKVAGNSFSYSSYLGVSSLRGGAIIDGGFPDAVVFWRVGDALRYVGFSSTPGCVSMTLSRIE